MCRQRAGCNPGAAKADGQAWWKLGLCAGKGPPPTSSATIAQIWAPIWVQDMPAKCCPAACTFKARAEGLAQVKPAQAPLRVWCPHGRQRTGPAVGPRRLHQVDDLNRYYGNAGTAALALKGKTFRRKTYLPKAYNFSCPNAWKS